MTLLEMSAAYAESEAALRFRSQRCGAGRQQQDPEAAPGARAGWRRWTRCCREMRALAELTAHYYDRSYHKHESYTL